MSAAASRIAAAALAAALSAAADAQTPNTPSSAGAKLSLIGAQESARGNTAAAIAAYQEALEAFRSGQLTCEVGSTLMMLVDLKLSAAPHSAKYHYLEAADVYDLYPAREYCDTDGTKRAEALRKAREVRS